MKSPSMNRFCQKQQRRKQQGAVLAISLILLLVLTLAVMSSTQNIVLQERMTAAVRDGHVSLAVAEAGIADAEVFIDSRTDLTDFNADGTNGYFSLDKGPADFFNGIDWSDGTKWQTSSTIDGMTAQYVIVDIGILQVPAEDLSGINMMGYGQTSGGGDVNAFQIVSRATGKSGTAERMVMTYYGKRF
jgi:type IV pilus assembly protein PilX